MPDKTIGDIEQEATQVYDADLLLLEQNGTAKKLLGSTLVSQLLNLIDGHGGITSITWTESGASGNGRYHVGTITMADSLTSEVIIRDGLKGDKGDADHVYIKYAARNPISDTDIGDNPDVWMGVLTSTADRAPETYAPYTWYKIKGEVGPGAQLVSRTVQYQESTSPTTPDGTWQDTVPTVTPGNYLWTHVTLTFDSGSPVEWDTVSHQGVDGAGSVSTVNGKSPDTNHNVAITAADVPYDTTDTVADKIAEIEGTTTDAQPRITATGILKGTGNGGVSAASLGTDYGAWSFNITLRGGASRWSNNKQTFESTAFRNSGFAYFVSPATDDRTKYLEAGIYADDVTTNGYMDFYCESVPTSDIVVKVVRVVCE